jgi:mRNA-degrading endonuclease toxin of MazEF toxin-antitoxin module
VTINRGDIVVAPFRFTDLDRYRVRPVLVVSDPAVYAETRHVIAVMITLAAGSAWPLDISVEDCASAHLREGSIIRMKLFSIAEDTIQATIGQIDAKTLAKVSQTLGAILI